MFKVPAHHRVRRFSCKVPPSDLDIQYQTPMVGTCIIDNLPNLLCHIFDFKSRPTHLQSRRVALTIFRYESELVHLNAAMNS